MATGAQVRRVAAEQPEGDGYTILDGSTPGLPKRADRTPAEGGAFRLIVLDPTEDGFGLRPSTVALMWAEGSA